MLLRGIHISSTLLLTPFTSSHPHFHSPHSISISHPLTMKIIDHFGDEQEESSAVVFLAVLSSVLEGCLHVVVHSMAVGLLVEHWEVLLK